MLKNIISLCAGLKRFIVRRYKIRKNIVSYYRTLGCRIGDRCEIHPTVNFGSEPYLISIGNHVRINKGVELVTHDGGVWIFRERVPGGETITLFGSIHVGDNVHIGTNAIIMPNVRIGNNCVIGCGSVVTHNVPDNTIVAGVPAKRVESVDDYYEKNFPHFEHTKLMNEKELKEFLASKYCEGVTR